MLNLFAALCASTLVWQPRAAWQPLSAHNFGRPIESRVRIARLGQITPRLNEQRLDLLSLRIENVLTIWLPLLASLLRGRKALEALSRQIVSLFSPDTLGLVSIPGSAATAGHPHQP